MGRYFEDLDEQQLIQIIEENTSGLHALIHKKEASKRLAGALRFALLSGKALKGPHEFTGKVKMNLIMSALLSTMKEKAFISKHLKIALERLAEHDADAANTIDSEFDRDTEEALTNEEVRAIESSLQQFIHASFNKTDQI